jgi:serine/threonine-protein kinase
MVGRLESGKECPKLVDFGIAHINPKELGLEQKRTMDFAVSGSPRYMSPEQCVGAVVDERTDIYSLACVMYECAAGRPVFDDLTVYELFNKHVNYPPKTFAKVCPDLNLPESLELLLLEMLQKPPEKRIQTVPEVKERLLVIYRQLFGDF